jgi:hypothetical protein
VKKAWKHGFTDWALAYQVQSPEFKPQYCQKKKKKERAHFPVAVTEQTNDTNRPIALIPCGKHNRAHLDPFFRLLHRAQMNVGLEPLEAQSCTFLQRCAFSRKGSPYKGD